GERGNLAAAEPWYTAGPDGGQTCLLWGELGPSREQELAGFGTVVHRGDVTAGPRSLGCPVGTRLRRDSLIRAEAGSVKPVAPVSGRQEASDLLRRCVRCVVLLSMRRAMSASRTGPSRRSWNRPMRSSGCPRPASALRSVAVPRRRPGSA